MAHRKAAIGRLQDRVALVTGAASGIGLAIARAFAREGAHVALSDLDRARTEQAAAQLSAERGTVRPVVMDVTLEEQVETATTEVIRTLGRLDILVSNAGIQIVSPLSTLAWADWRRVLSVQLDGAFLTTRAALRQMYRQGNGSILYMGSVHSKEASVLKAPYVAAKHALLGLARVVSKEGAMHGVRANVICPGFVRTPLVEKQIPEQAEVLGLSEEEVIRTIMLKETVDGQFTTLEDVAEAAVFLASFESNALTGQSLLISHGWHME